MLHFLDFFLTVFHSAFVLFVVFGWIIPKFRKYHVTAILLTLVAWLLIGLYKGVPGYCPLTDWHWDVKRALGETDMPSSFIEYMAESVIGLNFPTMFINVVTVSGLVFGIAMSVTVYLKHLKNSSKKSTHIAS